MTALLALLLALQQAPAPAPAPAPASGAPRPAQPAAPSTGAPAPARRPAAATTLQIRVTDRSGVAAEGAVVSVEGPVSRDGKTDTSGAVQFRSMNAGTYRVRAERDGFITLEKEIAVRAGTPATAEFALSAAPPPPPPPPAPEPPPPAPAATGPRVEPGDPRVLSLADLAERSLTGRDPIRLVPIGCSGLDNAQMMVLRETLSAPANAAIDQLLYVVAGEAMLTLDGRDQPITSGWFALVPRGMPHTLTRRGRNPAIVLAIAGGQPCAAGSSR